MAHLDTWVGSWTNYCELSVLVYPSSWTDPYHELTFMPEEFNPHDLATFVGVSQLPSRLTGHSHVIALFSTKVIQGLSQTLIDIRQVGMNSFQHIHPKFLHKKTATETA